VVTEHCRVWKCPTRPEALKGIRIERAVKEVADLDMSDCLAATPSGSSG
jgi:hypothetical protein